ncbi:hypothetical protein C0Q70_02144 [Pomacea canaliculata]|uniref:SRCR domain-containing protein n=2 Tax=Pomacea canaliculata TaxID=400727 RepID=A0A2T7Q1I1_POMCA|nr:hypothetical protein C0Q70_02144 [Pomacea canaliculata]
MEWYFAPNVYDPETIATYVDGRFLVPQSTHQRLYFAENVGLTISNLTHEDFGTYSVRVDIRSGSSFVSEVIYATLHQPVPPTTEDELLHARMLPNAAFSSGEWHVQLACGRFISVFSTFFSVNWKTPSGRLLPTDQITGSDYILKLTNPIEEGNYSCFIDIHEPAARCAHVPSTMLVSNEIHVDDCSVQTVKNNAAKHQMEDIASAFKQLVMTGSESGNVRLVNGNRPWNGRIELKSPNGTWGAMCSTFVGLNTAPVVCRMLGLTPDPRYSPYISYANQYGISKLPALTGYVSCTGNEDSIFNCSISYNGQSCDRYYDLGVDCWPTFTTD